MRNIKIEVKPNKSLTYMLPFLDDLLKFKFKHLLLNSYVSFDGHDDLFCILYDWKSDPEFLKYEGDLMDNPLFVSHDDYDKRVLYKFRLPEKLLIGKNQFLQGKYKDFSATHKESIRKYLEEKKVGNLNNILEILSNTSKRESSQPDRKLETFQNSLTITEHVIKDFEYEGN